MVHERVHLSPPDVRGSERELLDQALQSGWLAPVGPDLDAFEQDVAETVGAPHAVAVTTGTAALHLALLLLDVPDGSEVLVPTLTFAATANAVTYVGGTPTFIDADPDTWQIDPDLLADVLSVRARQGELPSACIAVDLYGQCADYDRILGICDAYHVPVIEDAAEALGATYRDRAAGSFGAISVLSFNGNKMITTSGGGMLLSDNPRWVERARYLATQARQDAPHYEHTEIGYNYRLSNLLAALGRAQLRSLDERIAARRAINATYREELGAIRGVEFMPEADYGRSNCWLTCITIDPEASGTDRESVRLHMEEHDIETRPVWKPMHLQKVFADCQLVGGTVSSSLFEHGLCLPSGSGMTETQQGRVIDKLLEVFPDA